MDANFSGAVGSADSRVGLVGDGEAVGIGDGFLCPTIDLYGVHTGLFWCILAKRII
jgi:hypothetical protein